MSEFIKPGIVIGCLGVIKLLDTTDETVIYYTRIMFVVGVLLSWSLLGLLYLRLISANDQTPFYCSEADLDSSSSSSPLSSIWGQTEGGKTVETNNRDYDLMKLKSLIPQSLITPCIIIILHLYWGYYPPLLIQAILPTVTVLSSELSYIHFLSLFSSSMANHKELKRPWRTKGLVTQFREMKREVMKELNEGKKGGTGTGGAARRNKKTENRMKLAKKT